MTKGVKVVVSKRSAGAVEILAMTKGVKVVVSKRSAGAVEILAMTGRGVEQD